MRFSTVFSVLAVSAVALAGAPPNGDVSNGDPSNGPDAPAPQNATDFKSAFNGLGQQSGPPLLELGNCQDDSCTSQAVNDIVNAIKPCNSSLAPVPAGTGSDDDANTLLDFTTKIVKGLSDHQKDCDKKCPGFNGSYPAIDPPLSGCLAAAFNSHPGLLPLLAPKLGELEPILKDMPGFNLTRDVLGIH